MKRVFFIAAVAAWTLCGCVPSLHPLYTEADTNFDPALVGRWSQGDSKDSWTFMKEGEQQYKLVYRDPKGKSGEFKVHLLKASGRLFLDLFPADPDLDEPDFYKLHVLPAHTFMIVRQIEPTLQMAPLNPQWMKEFLEDHPDAIDHEAVDGRIILTAEPRQLQAFLVKHEKTEDAFGEFSDMTRSAVEKED